METSEGGSAPPCGSKIRDKPGRIRTLHTQARRCGGNRQEKKKCARDRGGHGRRKEFVSRGRGGRSVNRGGRRLIVSRRAGGRAAPHLRREGDVPDVRLHAGIHDGEHVLVRRTLVGPENNGLTGEVLRQHAAAFSQLLERQHALIDADDTVGVEVDDDFAGHTLLRGGARVRRGKLNVDFAFPLRIHGRRHKEAQEQKARQEQAEKNRKENKKNTTEKQKPAENAKRRLSFKERKEMEQLETEIAQLEEEKKTIESQLCSGTLDVETLTDLSKRLPIITETLDEKTMRWLELSEIEG